MSEPPPTVGSLLAGALRTQPSDRLDLELLLGEVLGLNRAGLLRERDTPVNATAAANPASPPPAITIRMFVCDPSK